MRTKLVTTRPKDCVKRKSTSGRANLFDKHHRDRTKRAENFCGKRNEKSQPRRKREPLPNFARCYQKNIANQHVLDFFIAFCGAAQ